MCRNPFYIQTKRLMVLLCAAAVLFCSIVPVSAADSGSCGNSLTWALSGDTLTISGSGAMWDYTEAQPAPWYPYRGQIARIILPEGLTRVGNFAFLDCSVLISVSLPDSVTSVGQYAFAMCKAMTMLQMSENLESIESGAFRECESLASVRLPQSLKRIDYQAFYRCASLTAITVPDSVMEMGMTVFAYCYNLIRADIQAMISTLPEWTFYGCEKLTDLTLYRGIADADHYAFYGCSSISNVDHRGTNKARQNIMDAIAADQESAQNFGGVAENPNTNSSTYSGFTEEGTDLTGQTITSTQTDSMDITSNETALYPNGSLDDSVTSADVSITVENDDSWEDLTELLDKIADKNDDTHASIYIKDGVTLPEDAWDPLAGKDITVTVQTMDGSAWQVDCSQLEKDDVTGNVDLSYQRNPANEEQNALLGNAEGYEIRFDNDVEQKAEVMIRLPLNNVGQYAFLYERDGDELNRIQGTIVDHSGYARFYLAAVDTQTEYLLGINVPGENTDDVIVPASLYKQFDISGTHAPIDYEITGIKSSWGMDIKQVTWIMAGVLGSSVAVIGVVLFLLNKRKLSKGYVPDLEEYEI